MPRTLAFLFLALPSLLTAQATSPRLGEITFPTSSRAAAAQAAFEEGVLWMHSFEYPKAAAAFQRAQQAEPGFAMAYWGEAMTHNHPIWNERNADAARAVLAKLGATPEARAAKVYTPRERAWLDAVEVLWADGPKPLRDTLYLRAMERVARDHPDDEADAFLSLAHLGLSQGVRDIPSYMRAGKIALDLFTRAPNHPGAAHYVIHAFDDPDHAILALDAAHAYSQIAPDAGHAQHMTTHIFLALGMWDDVARQNVVAMEAVRGNRDWLNWTPGHYTWWLHYARLQQGKWGDARVWLERQFRDLPEDAPLARRRMLYRLSDEWQFMVGYFDQVPAQMIKPGMDGPTTIFGRSYPSYQSSARGLEAGLATMQRMRAAAPNDTALMLLTPQLEALYLHTVGHPDSAVAVLREAVALEASLPMDFGPPAIVRPAHEALAELLLAIGRAGEAQVAFTKALARTPGRSRTLAGLALAARAADDTAAAERAMNQLRANFHAADAGALERLMASFAKMR
jgi:tetratricopeptide (TPR) repeat protein